MSGTPNSYTYAYDRWGNRWTQTQTAGTGGPQPSLNFNTVTNQVTGVSYDAAGNLTGDGIHTYKYDAEGNLIAVDGTADQYKYDALNHRVQTQSASGTFDFLYNPAGQRVTIYNATTKAKIQGQYYWGGMPVAFYSGGSLHFQHQNWLGTERVRTSYNAAVEGVYGNLPFGDAQTSSGSNPNTDAYHFAQLDHDSETNTDHAEFRQYYNTHGRWMSPDPYGGSYDQANPQSLNRYVYSLNGPHSFIDPSGLKNCMGGGFWQWLSCIFGGGDDWHGSTPYDPPWPTLADDPITKTRDDRQRAGASGNAPNNGQEPPPACQANILNATNNQFGTNYTNANVTNTFNYSTGAGPGQGTLNLNISGSTSGVSTGYYPVNWWTYVIGYGPTLHVVSGPGGHGGLDSQQTLPFGPNQGTFHIDSGYVYNPIGAFFHWLLNMTKAGGYPKC